MPYSANWFQKNGAGWSVWLSKFKGQKNLRFLEIGCFEGRATVWLLENILTDESSIIETIDTFEGGMEHKVRGVEFFENAEKNYQENILPFAGKVITHVGLSQVVLRRFRVDGSPALGEIDMFDFVYIDGSHRSAEVLEDAILSFRLLKPGGIMIFDDYKWARYEDKRMIPQMGINAFLQVFGDKFKVIEIGYQVCIEKNV